MPMRTAKATLLLLVGSPEEKFRLVTTAALKTYSQPHVADLPAASSKDLGEGQSPFSTLHRFSTD